MHHNIMILPPEPPNLRKIYSLMYSTEGPDVQEVMPICKRFHLRNSIRHYV